MTGFRKTSTYRAGSPQRGGRGGDPQASKYTGLAVVQGTSPAIDGGGPARKTERFSRLEGQARLDAERQWAKYKALFPVVLVAAVVFAGFANAQPFPGYEAPPFRFDNGAVGSITGGTGGGAVVEYYDGTQTISGVFDFEYASGETPVNELSRCIESDGVCEVVAGNQCYTAGTNLRTYSPSPNNALRRDLRHCEMTQLDGCITQNGIGGAGMNYPCFVNGRTAEEVGAVNRGAGDARLGNTTYCRTPEQTQDADCESVELWITYVAIPPESAFVDTGSSYSLDPAVFDACLSNPASTGCEWVNYDFGGTEPIAIDGSNMPQVPVNEPVPAPIADGATMNPGGYMPGGSGDTGELGTSGGAGGGTDPTGGGGEGEEGTGDGETTVEGTIDCTDCDGTVDGDSVDLPMLSFVAPGWLPAACPSPSTVSVFGQSITIMDYSYVCGFAGVIRIIVLVGSSIVALRIVFEGVS